MLLCLFPVTLRLWGNKLFGSSHLLKPVAHNFRHDGALVKVGLNLSASALKCRIENPQIKMVAIGISFLMHKMNEFTANPKAHPQYYDQSLKNL